MNNTFVRFYLDLTDLKDKYILHDIPLEKKTEKCLYIYVELFSGQHLLSSQVLWICRFKTKTYTSLQQVV